MTGHDHPSPAQTTLQSQPDVTFANIGSPSLAAAPDVRIATSRIGTTRLIAMAHIFPVAPSWLVMAHVLRCTHMCGLLTTEGNDVIRPVQDNVPVTPHQETTRYFLNIFSIALPFANSSISLSK